MRADQLRSAAHTIAGLLKKSDLLNIIRQYRDAREENNRQAAHARLGQSAKILIAGSREFGTPENKVCSVLHLDKVSSVDYWQALLNTDGDQGAQNAEMVQLYSRVMFASSHLPTLIGLLSDESSTSAAASGAGVAAGAVTGAAAGAVTGAAIAGSISREAGENLLILRLHDAGEKAADPDRVARAIDGIDMIYAASISLSRRPAIDLQLREISGHPEKLLTFLGDDEGIAALCTVLESIPEALEHFSDDEQLDIIDVVNSLPIFHDLATLAETGTFSDMELRDIDDTMHQGIVLALESGVVVEHLSSPVAGQSGAGAPNQSQTAGKAAHAGPGFADEAERRYGNGSAPVGQAAQPGVGQSGAATQPGPPTLHKGVRPAGSAGGDDQNRDAYYQQYLEERERLRDGSPESGNADKEESGKSSLTGLFKGLTRPGDNQS